MRICFTALKAYPGFNSKCPLNKTRIIGGAEVQLVLLAKQLVKYNRVKVDFIVGDYHQHNSEIWAGVTVRKGYWFNRAPFINIFFLIKQLINVKADVYVQSTLHVGSSLIALVARLLGKKFIYMVAHDEELDGDFEKKNHWLTCVLSKLVFILADMIIVQHNTQKQMLRKKFRRNGIVLDYMYPLPPKMPIRKKWYVLWVARCTSWKRPEIFIKLAQSLMETKFVMICPAVFGEEVYHNRILELAKAVPNLLFIKYVQFQHINKFFKNASLFVNTSANEGFPNTFIQAAKNGTPIISLKFNPDNILQKYDFGMACNDDFETMMSHVKELTRNSPRLRTLSKNAFSYAKSRHDIIVNANKFLHLVAYVLRR